MEALEPRVSTPVPKVRVALPRERRDADSATPVRWRGCWMCCAKNSHSPESKEGCGEGECGACSR